MSSACHHDNKCRKPQQPDKMIHRRRQRCEPSNHRWFGKMGFFLGGIAIVVVHAPMFTCVAATQSDNSLDEHHHPSTIPNVMLDKNNSSSLVWGIDSSKVRTLQTTKLVRKKIHSSVDTIPRGGRSDRHRRHRKRRNGRLKSEGAASEFEDSTPKKRFLGFGSFLRREAQKNMGAAFAAIGFVSSTVTALVTDRTQFRRWRPTVVSLKRYLRTSGIDAELSKALSIRLLENLIILSRIQKAILDGGDRRDQALLLVPKRQESSADSTTNDIPTMEEASRYMRYATAVYGTDMIRAAEVHVRGRLDGRLSPVTKDKISEHIHVPQEDIVLMNVDYGGNTHHLRHFVAIDHKHKAVVLSIRGSFSVSDMIVDVAAFSKSFCGGEAHSEMANQAERVWSVAFRTVKDALRQNKGYELVITGHSLGAGTACLVNVLCHSKRLVKGHKIRCFAFASPPVFAPLELAPEAVRSTTNYVYKQDAIPFLSADSVRRLLACIHAVESHTMFMSWIARTRLVIGRKEPDKSLVDAVMRAASTTPTPRRGAPILSVPAASTMWIYEDPKRRGHYNVKKCDAKRLATLGICVHPNMITDHLPPKYEDALSSLDNARKREDAINVTSTV